MKKLILKLRKRYNKPAKNHQFLIDLDCIAIDKIAQDLSSKDYREQINNRDNSNSNCPKCKGKHIVDKIAHVNGSGSVSGSFYLGSGSIYGSSSLDTNSVNHCNDCGHQWKKYVINYKSNAEYLATLFNDFNDYNNGNFISKYNTVLETFNGLYAESLYKKFNEVYDNCYISTQDNLNLEIFRKYFKSVYDISK